MNLHTILLQPTDVLFFRDGRPMSGSLAGHTGAWPLPDVTNHAFHAALHRAEFTDLHGHDHYRPDGTRLTDVRQFGSLRTAGPFPVRTQVVPASTNTTGRTWFFPRPRDTEATTSVEVTLRPSLPTASPPHPAAPGPASSLPPPLRFSVASTRAPTKEARAEPWISGAAFQSYLRPSGDNPHLTGSADDFLRDDQLADTEQTIGIGINPDRQTQDGERFYAAHYLRLREEFRLGLFAEAMDKIHGNPNRRRDLIADLLRHPPERIVVGGQQRLCTAQRCDLAGPLPFPRGLTNASDFLPLPDGRLAVKWVLFSPAVWPEMSEGVSRRGTSRKAHQGGWLPNWICPRTGQVLLERVDPEERRRRRRLNAAGEGYESRPNIAACLAAALIPKPLVVTGWALPSPFDPGRESHGGAKSTHLAVPAGAVYYFEADTPEAAQALAGALNWHGAVTGNPADDYRLIKNRRSTLLGEKGFGLGVCGTWELLHGHEMK